MTQAEDHLISIDEPKSYFRDFLGDKQNKRIFFSGKFGVGKTFFLQNFFKDNEAEYDAYHLFPIRYQISTNENIIELIKYDILIELLKKYPDALKDNKTNGSLELFLAFCRDKGSINGFLKSTLEIGEDLLSLSGNSLLQVLGKLGRPLKDLLIIDKEFHDFKKEHEDFAENFLEKTRTDIDVIEADRVSDFLGKKILDLKSSKRSVLVLDDFDRIDPEHVFRVLNVLSAHMEGEENNRFGFDHIIIVGDIHNIQSIFHHKYGDNADFWGYFDKFFTIEPYEFNNRKAIIEIIPYFFKNIKYENSDIKNIIESETVSVFLEEVLTHIFAVEDMNLRQLYKFTNHVFPEFKNNSYRKNYFQDDIGTFIDIRIIDIGIKLLIVILGGKDLLLRMLGKIKNAPVTSHPNQAWRYEQYSSSMLREILSLKPNEKAIWLNKYHIVATTGDSDDPFGRMRGIYLDNKMQGHARFFYDTLTEYVIQSKYEHRK